MSDSTNELKVEYLINDNGILCKHLLANVVNSSNGYKNSLFVVVEGDTDIVSFVVESVVYRELLSSQKFWSLEGAVNYYNFINRCYYDH